MVAETFFTSARRRKEIPGSVVTAVFKRCLKRTESERWPDGNPLMIQCERCGAVLGGKKFQYDHTQAEVFQRMHPNERPPITADDVKLLGLDCCHKAKTGREVKALAKTKRLAKGVARAGEPRTSRWPAGKDSPWKARVGGGVKRRYENE
jgi:hypothetical protein